MEKNERLENQKLVIREKKIEAINKDMYGTLAKHSFNMFIFVRVK